MDSHVPAVRQKHVPPWFCTLSLSKWGWGKPPKLHLFSPPAPPAIASVYWKAQWTPGKKIANLALKLQGLKQPGPPPDLIGRVSLDIVALVCHVERHTVPRHTKLRRHVTRRGPRAAQPVHTFPQLDQLVSH